MRISDWSSDVCSSDLIPSPEDRLSNYPHQMSGGMKQRVLAAMATSLKPGLLLADEPTTALDVTIQEQILGLLAEIRERQGTSIILVTHDLGVVRRLCDRVRSEEHTSELQSLMRISY